MSLSKNAISLLRQRYCQTNEQAKDVYKRVSNALALGDTKFEKRLQKYMEEGIFLPNSPCIRNAGIKKGMLNACFVLDVQDTMESISDTLKDMIVIFKHGGGVGINFSKLRPKNSNLGTGGTSSGVVSFMKLFDTATEVVKQGGFRRGALMGVLNFEHAEILEFIRSKLTNQLTNFNISVLVSDVFMSKVEKGENIDLINPQDNKVWNTVNAKTIFDVICFSAWNSGDPGFLFYDRINKDNMYFPKIKIKCSNPCFTGDTKLDTPHGQIPIKNLVGKQTSIYCYDGEKINVSTIHNIRKTGIKQEVWKIVLDNNKEIKVTPDHKFMLRDGTYKEVKNLIIGDSLMPFNRHKRNSKGYNQISLNNGKSIGEAQLVCEWKYERKMNEDECVHHVDGNKQNNSPENLEFKDFKMHNSEHIKEDKNSLRRFPQKNPVYLYPEKFKNENNGRWRKDIDTDTVVSLRLKGWSLNRIAKCFHTSKKPIKKRLELVSLRNHKVKSIEFYGYEDVYDGEVKLYHNFALEAGIIVHNCGESPLPPYGACCLGSVNISKFVKRDKFEFEEFSKSLEIAVRTLRNLNAVSWYPLPQITKVMKELDPIGVGIMGFADTLIMLGIKYDSEECLKFIDEIGKIYKDITDKLASKCFWKRIIAPTGSLSILADCSSGIEPVFETTFERHLTVGIIEETREIYKSKYCRTAHQINPDWHLKVQAQFQKWLDGSISKTVNLPNEASVDDVKNIYLNAWKLGCKGITVFRDGCKEGVLKRKNKCSDESCHL